MSFNMSSVAGSLPAESLPITNVCIVSDANKCPHGYEVLLRTVHDKGADADLWRDSFFSSKIRRYLCVTRQFPINQGGLILNSVVTDLALLGERERIPQGYASINETMDSREQALQKRRMTIRLEPRNTTRQAINKIIFTKNKRAPEGFTLAGEINGLNLCYRIGEVPVEQQQTQHAVPPPAHPQPAVSKFRSKTLPAQRSGEALPYDLPGRGAAPPVPSRPSQDRPSTATLRYQNTALSGIDFQLSSRLTETNGLSAFTPDIRIKSYAEIDAEYSYDFVLERSTLNSTGTGTRNS